MFKHVKQKVAIDKNRRHTNTKRMPFKNTTIFHEPISDTKAMEKIDLLIPNSRTTQKIGRRPWYKKSQQQKKNEIVQSYSSKFCDYFQQEGMKNISDIMNERRKSKLVRKDQKNQFSSDEDDEFEEDPDVPSDEGKRNSLPSTPTPKAKAAQKNFFRSIASVMPKKHFRKTNRESQQPNFIIIYPDDKWKGIWDIFIVFILAYCTFITPFKLAFIDDDDTLLWMITDTFMDISFSIDIIFSFLTAYYDNDSILITEKSLIAKKYIKGYFFIDVISVVPVSLIFHGQSVGGFTKLARLPRLYRFIKITKLVRILKMSVFWNISKGLERIFATIFIFFILVHITACFWYWLAQYEGLGVQTWVARYNLIDQSTSQIYVSSLYWATTSVSVGFGDMNGTTSEKLFQLVITLIGVSAVSFGVGSITSVLAGIDEKQASLKTKLHTLDEIAKEFPEVDESLYLKVRKALIYQNQQVDDRWEFLSQLPASLKSELTYIIHHAKIRNFNFFKRKSKKFIADIAEYLKPYTAVAGEYIYQKDEPAEKIFFIVKGQVALMTGIDNREVPFLQFTEKHHLGDIDFVIDKKKKKRIFSAMAINDVDLLVLDIKEVANWNDEDQVNELAKIFKNAQFKYEKFIQTEKVVRENYKLNLENEKAFLEQFETTTLLPDDSIAELNDNKPNEEFKEAIYSLHPEFKWLDHQLPKFSYMLEKGQKQRAECQTFYETPNQSMTGMRRIQSSENIRRPEYLNEKSKSMNEVKSIFGHSKEKIKLKTLQSKISEHITAAAEEESCIPEEKELKTNESLNKITYMNDQSILRENFFPQMKENIDRIKTEE